MVPIGSPRWNFDRIAIGILIALIVVHSLTVYRHWDHERKSRKADFDVILQKMRSAFQIGLEAIPTFDPSNIRQCFVLRLAAEKVAQQGLLDPQKVERFGRLFSQVPPLKTDERQAGQFNMTYASADAQVRRWIDAGDRASLGAALDRCTETVTARLAE